MEDRLNKMRYLKLGELKPSEGVSSRQASIIGPGELKPFNRDRLNSPQSNTTYPNRHMHAGVAREEQPYAPGCARGGAIAPDTSLDRRGPLMSPPVRSTAAASAAAAAAALV